MKYSDLISSCWKKSSAFVLNFIFLFEICHIMEVKWVVNALFENSLLRQLSTFTSHNCLMYSVCTHSFFFIFSTASTASHTPSLLPFNGTFLQIYSLWLAQNADKNFPFNAEHRKIPKLSIPSPRSLLCATADVCFIYLFHGFLYLLSQKKKKKTSTVGRFLPVSFILPAQYLWSSARRLFSQS